MRWRHFQRLSERYILVEGYDDEDDPDELEKGAVGWDDVVLTALVVLQMCLNCCKHAYRSCPSQTRRHNAIPLVMRLFHG